MRQTEYSIIGFAQSEERTKTRITLEHSINARPDHQRGLGAFISSQAMMSQHGCVHKVND